jgi:hypothetical protein
VRITQHQLGVKSTITLVDDHGVPVASVLPTFLPSTSWKPQPHHMHSFRGSPKHQCASLKQPRRHRTDGLVNGTQVVYGSREMTVRGFTFGRGPSVVAALLPSEVLVGVLGRTGSALEQLTFVTSFGRTLGPFGGDPTGGFGTPFNFYGTVTSFFGGVSSDLSALSGIGFWTDTNATPPPPRPPSPPFTPPSPSPPTTPARPPSPQPPPPVSSPPSPLLLLVACNRAGFKVLQKRPCKQVDSGLCLYYVLC